MKAHELQAAWSGYVALMLADSANQTIEDSAGYEASCWLARAKVHWCCAYRAFADMTRAQKFREMAKTDERPDLREWYDSESKAVAIRAGYGMEDAGKVDGGDFVGPEWSAPAFNRVVKVVAKQRKKIEAAEKKISEAVLDLGDAWVDGVEAIREES